MTTAKSKIQTFIVHSQNDDGEPIKKMMALYPCRDSEKVNLGILYRGSQFRQVVQYPFPDAENAMKWAQQAYVCGEKFEA